MRRSTSEAATAVVHGMHPTRGYPVTWRITPVPGRRGRAEFLVELQSWSEDPQIASRLHGNPESIRCADVNAATLTDDQASYIGVNVDGPYKVDHYRY